MYPIEFSYTPADDDADGFANDVAGTSGVAFVLSATTVGDGLAHKVIITPSGSVSGSYIITGTDADGSAQTETLATNTTSAVTSVRYYATLTSVLAPSGIGANTVDIGWTDVAVGPAFVLNWREENFQVSLGLVITGTISVTVQHCLENLYKGEPTSDLTWWPHASLVTKTSSADGNYASPVTATRLLINSLTATATVKFQVVQGR